MKKTLAVAGTVVALVVVPGMASAAEAVTVPANLVMQTNCATDGDGGSKPVENGAGSGTGTPSKPETTTKPGATPSTTTSPTQTATTTTTTSPSPSGSASTSPSKFAAGRLGAAAPRQQAADDCSGALEPGSSYSDEDGDGEPEVKDQADDDRDGQVDEVETASQVSVVPDGGAETGDGSTGGAVGMTAAGAAVLALFAGFGLWVRRALARA
ncbi:hypothetical protein [Actinomycetospora atypica]|uniref:Uncharacterized protein n=1 Tax=Actinomycetospora atypica TaxID=1290095 RepID=A0ABV9YM22_9PSEU